MNLFGLIDESRKRWNVLEHPFYLAWSAGGLSHDQLALYAGQYRHAVEALADLADEAGKAAEGVDPATRAMLEDHALEEARHIEIWDDFATSLGGYPIETPLVETDRLVKAWVGEESRDLNSSLAALYAIEVTQPGISATKAAGLVEHYGFEPGTPGIRYFELHQERDVEHAAQCRALLEARTGFDEFENLVRAAESALSANWDFLDGVGRLCRIESRLGVLR